MLLYELFNKTAKKRLLFTAQIALTPECNLSCRHCYMGSPGGGPLSTEEFKDIIDQLAHSGCLFLTLTGGEPTLYPGFWEILAFAREKKFFLRLYTNGTLIDEKAAGQLASFGVNEVNVSLYGHRREIHELVTGVSGSFDKTVHAIQLLKLNGIKVQVKSSIMKLNRDYPVQIEDFCRRFSVKCYISYLLSPRIDGSEEPLLLQYPNGYYSRPITVAAPKPSAAPSDGTASLNLPSPCPAGENSCYVEYDGTLYPCVNYRYPCGNLTKSSLSELWNSKEMIGVRMSKETPAQCATCSSINNCLRCPGLSYHESRLKNGYSQIQCRQTELLRKLEERSVKSGHEGICQAGDNY